MIKRLLLVFILFLGVGHFAYGKVTLLDYKATFGIFGTVGTIKNKLTQNGKRYQIHTKVQLAGLAKVIMGGQSEDYVSKGHIQNGIMVSDSYIRTSTKKDKVTKTAYTINHKTRHVTKRMQKWLKGKLVKDTTEKLTFYAKDDLLTLYFNLGRAVNPKGGKQLFRAVGLEKQNGKVFVTVPTSVKETASYKKDLGNDAKIYAKALIYQKNFRKKKGDILLAVANDGFIQKSVIKDVLLYGDAKLVRVR